MPNTNPKCPHCGGNAQRHGKTSAGKQRYRCANPDCRKRFTPGGVGHRQKSATPEQITQIHALHGEGVGYRTIAKRLGLSPSSVYRVVTGNPYT